MKANVGTVDRIVRIVVAVLASLWGYGAGGGLGWVLYLVAAIALFTGISGFCPLYATCGLSTCSVNREPSGGS